MKINGMKMRNYWMTSFLTNLILYALTALTFVFSGKYIFEMQFFIETSNFVIFIVLLAWGLAQISFAFFLSVFLSRS